MYFDHTNLKKFIGSINYNTVTKVLKNSKEFYGTLYNIEGAFDGIKLRIKPRDKDKFEVIYNYNSILPLGTILTKENLEVNEMRDVILELKTVGIDITDKEKLKIVGYDFDIAEINDGTEPKFETFLTYILKAKECGHTVFLDERDIKY